MQVRRPSGSPNEDASHVQVLHSIMSQIAMVREGQVELDRKLSNQAAIVEELVRGVGADVKSLLSREQQWAGRAGGSFRFPGTPTVSTEPSTRPGSLNGLKPCRLADLPRGPDLCESPLSRSVSFDCTPVRPELQCAFYLKPDSFLRLLIDCCTIIALVFDAFTVPFVIAWDPPIQGFLKATMFCTTAVWILDLCANFVTGFYEDGLLVMDAPAVARHYLRHWFPVDFCVVLLDVLNIFFELLGGIADEGVSMHLATLFRVFKIQRFIRFLAILRLGRIWGRVNDLKGMVEFSLSKSKLWMMLIEILKFLIVIIWLNHSLCCIFYAIGKIRRTDTGESWLDRFDGQTVTTEFEYMTAFHFTLTQMTPGSMEVFATNSVERIFTITWLLFGLLFGSSLVSFLSAHLVQFNQQNTERAKTQATLRRFLRQHGIHATLAYRVQHDVMQRLHVPAPLLEREIPCLSKLSAYLRGELWLAMFTPHISPHALFYTWHFIDPSTTRDICFACHFMYLPAKDELFHKGCRKTSVHILAQGQMRYMQTDSTSLMMEDAPQITEGAWISEAAWWMHWTTQGSMETLTECKLVCLEASQLMEVLANHPRTEALILAYGLAFHKLASSMPAEQLSDLSFLDHGEVVSHMPREDRQAVAEIVLGQQRISRTSTAAPLVNPADVRKLRFEVERGRCALVFGQWGRPVHVVSVVVLHIVWPSRGRILAQLASETEAEPAFRCQLPTTQCSEGESPHDAAVRLLSELHALLPEGEGYEEEFGEYEKIVVHQQRSDDYAHLPSRITRNIFRLQVRDQEAGCLSPRSHGSAAQCHEALTLFSWLSLEDYERFSSGADVAALAARISAKLPEGAPIAC